MLAMERDVGQGGSGSTRRPWPTLIAWLVVALIVGIVTLVGACSGDTVSQSSAQLQASVDTAEAGATTTPLPTTPLPTTPRPTTALPTTQPSATPDTAATPPVATNTPATTAPTTQPTAVPTTAPILAAPVRPPAPNGRSAPAVATTAAELAAQVDEALMTLANPGASPAALADAGHLHQVAIRKLGYNPEWDAEFFAALASGHHESTLLHLEARRALLELHSGYDAADFIPAWAIIEPASIDDLRSYYEAAEAATGIEWEYLAGINLIETGMGRIRGLSSAGAQGPMQFLPTTWNEAGIGEGDINDPADAIAAAARYLVRRGGPADMTGALWGYNNSDNYVAAVQAYAEMLRRDPNGLVAIYNWEIYFHTDAGDVWLPTGFRTDESIDLDDFLTAHPWSQPDPELR